MFRRLMFRRLVGRAVLPIIGAMIIVVGASQANAAPLELRYDFTAQNFFSFFGPPPTDSVVGSFTINYDSDLGGGGAANSVPEFTIGSFAYNSTNTAFNAAPNGSGLTIAFGSVVPGFDSFMLQFTVDTVGEPIVGPGALSYTTSLTGFAMFQTIDVSVIASSPYQAEIFPNPIPAALPLLLTSIAGLGAMGWRRRRSARRA